MTSSDMPVRFSGGPPRLTPGELQSVTFPRAPLGRRGFDEDRVRAFLQQVERELTQILQEKAALADEAARLRRHLAEGNGSGPNALPAEDAHIQAVRILSQAQQTADRYVEDAERYSRELAQEARRHRDEILADARARAALVLEEAHQQASSAAAAVTSSSEEPMSAGERRELEREIAYLRTFSDVYRGHLKSYLEALLRNVEEWERSENESVAATRSTPDLGRLNGSGAPDIPGSPGSSGSPGMPGIPGTGA